MNDSQQLEAFVGKILESARGTFEIFGMYLGVRLGYYKALSEIMVTGHSRRVSEASRRPAGARGQCGRGSGLVEHCDREELPESYCRRLRSRCAVNQFDCLSSVEPIALPRAGY